MWKAILVLFLTSHTQPMSMMLGQFPNAFASKADCQAFLDTTRGDIKETIKVFGQFDPSKVKVLDHTLSCIEDKSGEPA